MFKVVIFGSGMLGKQCCMKLSQYYDIMMYSHSDIDICNISHVQKIINKYDIVINCAAYTNVDKAEQDKEMCYDVNVNGIENLAILCKKYNKKLIHISTDFVYGNNNLQIENFQDSLCNPLNYYGQTKYLGQKKMLTHLDKNYLILRVSWLFGQYGNNFITTVKNKLLLNQKLQVVDNQIGRPTSTALVVQAIKKYISNIIPDGLYNLTNSGQNLSKYQLSCYIRDMLKLQNQILPIKTDNSGKYAVRQHNSKLNCDIIDKYLIRPTWIIDVEKIIFNK